MRKATYVKYLVYTTKEQPEGATMYASIEAAVIRQNVQEHNYQTARALTRALLDAGRVAYEQADKHNGGTAQILVDGERVGQFSVLSPGMEFADLKKIDGWYR